MTGNERVETTAVFLHEHVVMTFSPAAMYFAVLGNLQVVALSTETF
jgi:hypothetical protein